MIKVQDWMASIPDGEKHIAYVGEGSSEIREFLLCGDGWETYKNWTFHLDMAFDPESITTRDTRHVVETHSRSNETKGETAVNKDESVTEETYTVHHRIVEAGFLSDVAHLEKKVEATGIRLTWTVLRQHTALPGKLWATLRAVGSTAEKVKKSAIMVFEVDAAVSATPASTPAISEMEQMENRVAHMVDVATYQAQLAQGALAETEQSLLICQDVAREVADVEETVKASTAAAEAAAQQAATERATAANAAAAAGHYCAMAAAYADNAEAAVDAAQEAVGAAQEAVGAAQEAATAAETARKNAGSALNKCNNHSMRCEDAQLRAEDAKTAAQGACEEAQAFADAAEAAARRAETAGGGGGGGTAEYNRVSVRDYGAVGDGVADDRQAIIDAFTAAKSMLPCEVYFPAGTYGISNGITVEMEYGTGGLLVRGAGRDITAIKYLDSFTPQSSTQWYAIRIWPVGRPNTAPNTEDEYLHDISITGLTVYDEHPYDHVWNSHKGDAGKEENHGFDIQYCKRVSVTDCKIDSVGDEGIDIFSCHDVVIMNNHLVNTPGAGYGGGAISIGDGSKGVVVSNNTINKTAEDEVLVAGTVLPAGTVLFADTTLADGTTLTAGTTLTEPITLAEDMVLAKSNFGIAVESLSIPVSDVVVTGNTILGVRGSGVHFNTPQTGAKITNLSITDNIISDCTNGIVASGTNPKNGLKIHNNMITDCAEYGIELTGGLGDVTIVGNTIRNVYCGVSAKKLTSRQLYADNLFENIGECALYVRGQVMVKNCVFNDVSVTATTGTNGAILNDVSATTNGKLTVQGCTMTGIRSKYAIYGAQVVRDTDIGFVDANGNNTFTAACFGGSKDCLLHTLVGGNLGGRVEMSVDEGIIMGAKITYSGSTNAVNVKANKVSVTGCIITNNSTTSSYKAILEADGKNYNLFANNIVNRSIVTVGAQSVAVNNIDTRVTA